MRYYSQLIIVAWCFPKAGGCFQLLNLLNPLPHPQTQTCWVNPDPIEATYLLLLNQGI